jgi:hypothetical protein
MIEFGLVANMQIDEERNLDIFDMFVGTNEPTKEMVNKDLLMFRRVQVNVKDIKCSLEWWAKHEFLFPIVAFSTCLILNIVSFQIVFLLVPTKEMVNKDLLMFRRFQVNVKDIKCSLE